MSVAFEQSMLKFFLSLDPRSKLILWVSMTISAMLLPISSFILLYCAAFLLIILPVGLGFVPRLTRFLFTFILPTFLMLVVVYGLLVPTINEHTRFIYGIRINIDGLWESLGITARLCIIILAGFAFTAVTSPMQLASALRTLKLSPELVAIFVSSFSIYTLALRKIKQISDAQRSRALHGRYILGRVRMYIPIMKPLLFGLIASAVERSALWQSREYLNNIGTEELCWNGRDTVCIVGSLLLSTIAGLLRWGM